ncbi:hypothetical protein V6N11_069006 [Hibiscus sabdariffa]|uniref:Uncharacterized protein n=2 Tax=Hibiscus sabdariffa TaxID=183260 RepID=A0ABR2BYB1_9ROSI
MHPTNTILNRAITWARYYSGICQKNISIAVNRGTPIPWKHPDPGWTCLNVDGAVSTVTGAGAIGGMLRDLAGSWIFGFQKGIETYCKEAVQMLNSLHADNNPFALLRAMVKLRQRGWVMDIIWVARDGNQAADTLAKSADSSALDVFHFLRPHEF